MLTKYSCTIIMIRKNDREEYSVSKFGLSRHKLNNNWQITKRVNSGLLKLTCTSRVSNFCEKVESIISNASNRVLTNFQTPWRDLKTRRVALISILTNLGKFGNPIKHFLECLISSETKLEQSWKQSSKIVKIQVKIRYWDTVTAK